MKSSKKKNPVSVCIDHVSSCMGPVIPVLIAGGLVKLLVVILTMTGLMAEGTTTEIVLSFIGDAPLYFLPFLVAYSASVHFHVNTVLALASVGAMMSPDFVELAASGKSLTFAGLPLVGAEYAYSTIPIILLVAAMIYREANMEPWEGKVAVGNVILNRVESPLFPDTVYDVIFDTRFGVQFSPAETGGIYCEPDDEAVIAAKLCLDGASVAGGSLYFVNPDIGADGWFKETKTFVATIGDHDFYA